MLTEMPTAAAPSPCPLSNRQQVLSGSPKSVSILLPTWTTKSSSSFVMPLWPAAKSLIRCSFARRPERNGFAKDFEKERPGELWCERNVRFGNFVIAKEFPLRIELDFLESDYHGLDERSAIVRHHDLIIKRSAAAKYQTDVLISPYALDDASYMAPQATRSPSLIPSTISSDQASVPFAEPVQSKQKLLRGSREVRNLAGGQQRVDPSPKGLGRKEGAASDVTGQSWH